MIYDEVYGVEKTCRRFERNRSAGSDRLLQTCSTGLHASSPIIDEVQERKHQNGLVCPIFNAYAVVRFGNYIIKTCTGLFDAYKRTS